MNNALAERNMTVNNVMFAFSDAEMALLLYETSETSLFSILSPHAVGALRNSRCSNEIKIASLDFLERVFRYNKKCDFKDTIIFAICNTKYIVASVALETFVVIYGREALDDDSLHLPSVIKRLQGEILTYNYIYGKMDKNRYLMNLKSLGYKQLAQSSWRISRILNKTAKGKRLLGKDSFFGSEKWLSMLRKHGKRGVIV